MDEKHEKRSSLYNYYGDKMIQRKQVMKLKEYKNVANTSHTSLVVKSSHCGAEETSGCVSCWI